MIRWIVAWIQGEGRGHHGVKYDPFKHHRRSIRLRGYDYSQTGAYFITLVTQYRERLFGKVADGQMRVNAFGEIVIQCWEDLPRHYAHVELDAFVVMPNHVHGIVIIAGDGRRGEVASSALGGETPPPRNAQSRHALGQIVAYFKYQSTKRINESRDTQGASVWQRNYYEHIIRNEKELERIRAYIIANPARWAADSVNPTKRPLT